LNFAFVSNSPEEILIDFKLSPNLPLLLKTAEILNVSPALTFLGPSAEVQPHEGAYSKS
jgi:hypothetical protein